MKIITIILALFFLSMNSSYAKETVDCSTIKKTSPKYLTCKLKSAGSSLKNKLTKKNSTKKDEKKTNIFKKFKDAKTLSDLKN